MDDTRQSPFRRRDVLRRTAAAGAIAAGGATLAGTAAAGGGDGGGGGCRLNWGREVAPARCDAGGDPVISVKRRVVDSLDSGNGDDVWWARDDYAQDIQAWQTDAEQFCVVSRFQGRFDAFAGFDSPEGDDTLTGEESGPFEGGYRGTITGALTDEPTEPTHGFIGTFDYDCDEDASRGGGAVCPGSVDWMDFYFDDADLSLAWWGWIYHAGDCGTWVNAIDGDCGDVACDG